MDDLTGQTLGDYHVYRRLGKGAMAQVYLARQLSLQREVALKVLNPDLARDDTYVARFQNEARAAAALVHANIVQIYEVGVAAGWHFIAQEYVAGSNVGDLIQREGQLSPGVTLDILRQVAAALCRAAEAGIVHRDIKPENLMLGRSGDVKVADFGLARANQGGVDLTQAGITMGTPLYMSPEQVEGRGVDARSDLYSLGVTAYHMLCGTPPFSGDTPLSVAVQHLNNPAEPLLDRQPNTPTRLAGVVDRLLSKKPRDRPESAHELLGELRDLAAEAAEQGWALGPENWPLAQTLSSELAAAPATHRLNALMRTTIAMKKAARGRRRRWRLAAVVGCLVAGLLLAAATRRPSILAAVPPGPAEKATIVEQIFHAKLLDTDEGWKIIAERFPDADEYYLQQAKVGLARRLIATGRFSEARPLCAELATLDNEQDFQLFGLAGQVICDVRLGEPARAEQTLTNTVLFASLDRLGEVDPGLAQQLDDAREKLGQPPVD